MNISLWCINSIRSFLIRIPAKTQIFFLLALFFAHGCSFQGEDRPPLQFINNVLLDGERIDFKAAKLSVTGPINISGNDSHVQALLEISTDEDFEIPPKPGTSLYRLSIYGKNEGFNLPIFPLQNGTFEVLESGIIDRENVVSLEGKNFVSPAQLLLSANNDGEWSFDITGDAGTIQINFDIRNELVQVTNNWTSEEGKEISGAVTLPLNLSNFRP